MLSTKKNSFAIVARPYNSHGRVQKLFLQFFQFPFVNTFIPRYYYGINGCDNCVKYDY